MYDNSDEECARKSPSATDQLFFLFLFFLRFKSNEIFYLLYCSQIIFDQVFVMHDFVLADVYGSRFINCV